MNRRNFSLLAHGLASALAAGAVSMAADAPKKPAAPEEVPKKSEIEFKMTIGGAQIVLGRGWEPIDQPNNFFVQKRARQNDRGITMSAGAFKPGLTLDRYAALALVGFQGGGPEQLGEIAARTGISREDLAKLLESPAGKKIRPQIESGLKGLRFEVLHAEGKSAKGGKVYEIHMRGTVSASGEVFHGRQFIVEGTGEGELVQVTFACPYEDVFIQKDLAIALRPGAKPSAR